MHKNLKNPATTVGKGLYMIVTSPLSRRLRQLQWCWFDDFDWSNGHSTSSIQHLSGWMPSIVLFAFCTTQSIPLFRSNPHTGYTFLFLFINPTKMVTRIPFAIHYIERIQSTMDRVSLLYSTRWTQLKENFHIHFVFKWYISCFTLIQV